MKKRHVPADVEIPPERKTDDVNGHAGDQDREQPDAKRLRADAPILREARQDAFSPFPSVFQT